MPIDDDISAFSAWANSLGFPIQDIPSDDSLIRLFRSKQSLIFLSIMDKVRSKQEVELIRKNILVSRMKKLKGEIIPVSQRCFLPKEMQRHLKIEDLKKRKSEIESKLKESKAQYEGLALSIKTKNIQKAQILQKNESLKARCNILHCKTDSISRSIANEETIREKINSIMPTKLNSSNASESVAMNAIRDSLKVLDEFYEIFFSDASPQTVSEAKQKLWDNLKKINKNVPNYLLWSSILKLKEEQLQNMILLNKSTFSENNNNNNNNSKIMPNNENHDSIEIPCLKANALAISIFSKAAAASKQVENKTKDFVSAYKQFVDSVKCKMSLYNTELTDDADDIISDFVVQYTTRSFNKGQIDFLESETERRKIQISEGNKIMKDHQMLIGSITQIYSDIEAYVLRMRQEMTQLTQIKDKILYSKSLLQYMLQDMKGPTQSQFVMNKFKMSNSIDSFEFSDNVFCSTQLDMDNTVSSAMNPNSTFNNTIRPENTLVRSAAPNILPQYVNELSVFMDIPVEKFLFMPKECYIYLRPNPLIIDAGESISIIQLTPGHLLTLSGSIEEVENKCEWINKMRQYTAELKTNITLVRVDEEKLKKIGITRNDEVMELLDKIDVIGVNTNRTLHKVAKYFNFILDNSLKNFIPSSKLFNGRTFLDYESEYVTYYRMSAG